MAVFPRAQGQAPHELSYNLADAISAARRDLNWALEVAGRPGLVPPPTHDVHFPPQTPDRALAEWKLGVRATQELAAAAREFLPEPGGQGGDLRAALDLADLAVRAVPRPPASLPVPAQDRAAAWQDLARFQHAAAELGNAVAAVLAPAMARWSERASLVSQMWDPAMPKLLAPGDPGACAGRRLGPA